MNNETHMNANELALANKICGLLKCSKSPTKAAQVLYSYAVGLADPDLELAASQAVDMTRAEIEGYRELKESLQGALGDIPCQGLESREFESLEESMEACIEWLDAELAAAESILAEAFTRICE